MRPQTGNREKKKKKRAEKTKGRTIRKLMGGGAGEIQKKSSRRVKLNEKNSGTPINRKITVTHARSKANRIRYSLRIH